MANEQADWGSVKGATFRSLCYTGWLAICRHRALACLFVNIFKIRQSGGTLSPGAKGESGGRE